MTEQATPKKHPKHCGRPMLEVKDQSNAPIWWCPECHAKKPRQESEQKS